MTVPETELPVPEQNEPPPVVEIPPEEAAPPEEQIEIGEKVFKTQAEALKFAREELQRNAADAAVAEAYRAGIADSQAANAPPPAPVDEATRAMQMLGITEEEFYADVPKALFKLSTKIREDLKTEMRTENATQTEDQKLWTQFNTMNPDLVGFEDDVKVTLTKFDKEVKALAATKGTPEAMKFLAQKTRAKFQEYIDRGKPQRALTNGTTAAAPTSQTNVTSKIVVEKPLSFTEQVKQNRAKRMS